MGRLCDMTEVSKFCEHPLERFEANGPVNWSIPCEVGAAKVVDGRCLQCGSPLTIRVSLS